MNKRVGIYLRVSTQEQSTELQAQEIDRYVLARGWERTKVYEDKATGTNGNRPMLKALLKDARERRVDVIICWRLDRLFRSLKDLITTLQEFAELGIEFISLKDNIDLSTSSGRLLCHLMGAFAEFEASLIRERVRAGLRAARAKGKRLGRRPTRVDANTIRQLRDDGLSIRKIASRLGLAPSKVHRTLAVSKSSIGSQPTLQAR